MEKKKKRDTLIEYAGVKRIAAGESTNSVCLGIQPLTKGTHLWKPQMTNMKVK